MKLIITILLLVLAISVSAQPTLPITLEKVLELSGANNLTIKEYQERQVLATAHTAKAKEWWLPQFSAGVNTHYLGGAVQNGNGKFFLDVDRNSLLLGLGLHLNWNIADGIYNVKIAKLKTEASAYIAQAERNKTLLKSIEAYYSLVTAQLNLVALKNIIQQSENISEQIRIQVDAGLRYQSEFLLAKSNTNHMEIEMLNAEHQYNMASTELVQLLHLKQDVILVSVDPTLSPLEDINKLATSSETMYSNRPEMKANEKEMEALRVKKRTYTSGLLIPEFNISANSGLFGSFSGEVTPVDAIAYPSPQQLYGTNILNAALTWKIPLGALIHNGDNKKYSSLIKLKEIRAAQYQSTINQEISLAYLQLQTGKKQIEIAKEGLTLSLEALEQSIERQKIGTAKPFEVFQAQQFYLQSQTDYVEVVSQYNKAHFALRVAKGEAL